MNSYAGAWELAKRMLFIFIGAVLFLIMGSIALIPVNNWYWDFRGFVGGYDDETRMLKFLILIEWPILLLIVGWLGNKHVGWVEK